jgi:hypothetical protein
VSTRLQAAFTLAPASDRTSPWAWYPAGCTPSDVIRATVPRMVPPSGQRRSRGGPAASWGQPIRRAAEAGRWSGASGAGRRAAMWRSVRSPDSAVSRRSHAGVLSDGSRYRYAPPRSALRAGASPRKGEKANPIVSMSCQASSRRWRDFYGPALHQRDGDGASGSAAAQSKTAPRTARHG